MKPCLFLPVLTLTELLLCNVAGFRIADDEISNMFSTLDYAALVFCDRSVRVYLWRPCRSFSSLSYATPQRSADDWQAGCVTPRLSCIIPTGVMRHIYM
jgi:hypothetical protein